MFQPEYHILKKAFEEKQPKEVIIRLFENQKRNNGFGYFSHINCRRDGDRDERQI